MNRKDRRDGLSKSGSGRVGIYRETGLTHIYTLECNYNTGLTLNAIKAAKGKGERLASPPREGSVDPKRYTQDDFEQLGRAVCVAMLDQVDANRKRNTWHSQTASSNLLTRLGGFSVVAARQHAAQIAGRDPEVGAELHRALAPPRRQEHRQQRVR